MCATIPCHSAAECAETAGNAWQRAHRPTKSDLPAVNVAMSVCCRAPDCTMAALTGGALDGVDWQPASAPAQSSATTDEDLVAFICQNE